MIYHEESNETAALYVAGTLNETETIQFEHHLLVCDSCRNEVRLAEVLRSELLRTGRKSSAWVISGTLAIAASLAIVFLRPGTNPVTKLGAVTSAPPYEGIAVRAATAESDSIFAAAMVLYQKQSYDEAAEKFAAARSAGADSVTTTFFLGASQLMAGKAIEATRDLERAARMGSSLYSAESRYYAAKAWLQAGKKNEALRALDAAKLSEGPVGARAASLADSVRALN